MELANIITGQLPTKGQSHFDDGAPQPQPQRTHSYPTRNTMTSSMGGRNTDERTRTPPATYYNNQSNSATPHSTSMSPFQSPTPKSIAFELLFQESPEYRARLPMRVNIFPHDTTDSIITTVKNFYGLYSGPNGSQGVSFEDEQSNTLIARYENLRNDMIVYVRVIEERAPDAYGPSSYHSDSPVISQAYYQGDGHQMPPPPEAQALNYGQPMSRPASRSSLKRSISPNHGRGRRSQSAVSNASIPAPMKKSQSRSGFKSRGSSTHGSFADINNDMMNGYSSGDGAAGSVSSKTKSEHLGNTEISLDNIVEGGRRKRAKFESSELPLFAPPQMPAATSNSSVSPARRLDHQRSSFPFTNPGSNNPFSNSHLLQSPQSYGSGFGQPGMYATPAHGRRTRGTAHPQRHSMGSTPGVGAGILPTPDPTVGSCMSEEDKDVALQLMRLGDMSNISHGRTSASTLDDTFSGRADAPSSTGATSDSESESEDELPPARRQKREGSFGAANDLDAQAEHPASNGTTEHSEYEDRADGSFKPRFGDDMDDMRHKTQRSKSTSQSMGKPRGSVSGSKSSKSVKSKGPRSAHAVKSKKSLSGPGNKGTMSPTSMSSQSRKASVASTLNFQHQLGDDEEDLSSKPRCQRCRKSKKGCDRQRPCQRCKDAGLSADQCLSEDEGNGRKGRYGRHMGVPVKKEDMPLQQGFFPPGLIATGPSPDKSKKRKR